jgi:hypothetical protein
MKFSTLIQEMTNTHGLTPEEQQVIHHLVEAYNLFVDLPDKHVSDDAEFSRYIHILQRHVMGRLARRTHPEIFGGS